MAFVDYEKAFDSVETRAVLASLEKQGINEAYIRTLKDINTGGYTTTTLHKESNKIAIQKGVRQGDTICPKLFTVCRKDIFRQLNWEPVGFPISGKMLKNLSYESRHSEPKLFIILVQILYKMLLKQ